MELFGLSTGALLAAGLLVTAFVTLLYLLKNEQRRFVVPAIFLWDAALGKKSSASFWTRLRRLLSLLLALAIALSLLLAIADPRVTREKSARSIVVLLDASASMQAQDGTPTRLDAAKRLARAELSSLGVSDRALIAQLDAAATPLCALSADSAEISHAISSVIASDLPADLARGVSFALNVLKGLKTAEIWLFSDGNVQGIEAAQSELSTAKHVRFRYFNVGKETRNLAIVHFGVRRYPLDKSRQEALVSVRNFGSAAEDVSLTISARGVPLYEESFSVPAREETTRVLSQLGASEGALKAEIKPKHRDALSVDDVAFAALPTKKRIRVLLVSEGNRYLEAALLLDEYLEVEERLPSQYQGADGFDAVIFDNFVPQVLPHASTLYLHPDGRASGSGPLVVKGEAARPYFERVDSAHEATRNTALRDVNIGRALVFAPQKADLVIAEGTKGLPLIVSGRREEHNFIALAFDVRESDLPLRPAWPLFLLGALDALSHGQEKDEGQNLVGATISVAVDAGKQAMVRTPNGKRTRLAPVEGQVRLELSERGLYEIQSGTSQRLIAANVAADLEGLIAPSSSVIVPKSAPSSKITPSFFVGKKPWLWLAVFAALLFVLEWLSFHRRWTV